MYRAIPVSNKICFDKEVKRSWRIHQEKLRSLRSEVSHDRPETFSFLNHRQKKQALQEVRNLEIDRENRVLLQKINEMGSRKSKREQTLLRKTLNAPFRKRELVKIVEENQEILKRIQQKKSSYDTKKMGQERKEIQKNISLISEFKYKDYPVTHTEVNLWATSHCSRIRDNKENPLPTPAQQPSLMHRGNVTIEEQSYIATSYEHQNRFVLQIEHSLNKKEKYRIELNKSQVLALLANTYQNNIPTLLQHLRIERDKKYCYLATPNI